MFGLKQMQRQRHLLYEHTKQLEKQATSSREKAKARALEMAISPTGLLSSFILGASTQCELSQRARRNLLNGTSRDVLNLLSSQWLAYMHSSPQSEDASEADSAAADVENQAGQR